jgi:hypothetical protein
MLKHRIESLIQDRTYNSYILATNVMKLPEILILFGDIELISKYIIGYASYMIDEDEKMGFRFS